MAHHCERLIEADLRKLLAFSPLVGVLGHRQVGKTTLVASFEKPKYVTLDSNASRDMAQQNPEAFVDG